MFVKIGDCNHKGNLAEAMITARAIEAGIPVLSPVTEHGRYDLVFDLGGRLARIQCKWGRRAEGVVVAHLSNDRRTAAGKAIRTRYSPKEIDAFAIYCGELDRCFLVPIEVVAGQWAMQIRLEPPRNGQRAGLHFAADYEFHGAVAQLGERLRGTQKVVGSSPISSTKEPEPASPTTTVGAHEFREHFGWYLERAAAGETINVTRRGKPHVQLRGLEGQAALELASSVA